MKSKNKSDQNKFGKIIINIFYQFFVLILFILVILILLYFLYRYAKNYIKNKLFEHKLTDIYINSEQERKFNYNFRINDYIVLDNNLNDKFKINEIDTKEKEIIIKTNNNKSFTIDLENYEIKDSNNDNLINNFKYISREPYYISFYIEYIFIKNKIEYFERFQKSVQDIRPSPLNYIDYIKNFFNQNDAKDIINKIKDDLIYLLYFDIETSNIKLDYKGSKKVDITQLRNDKMFRGNLFFHDDELYQNDYEIVNKKYDSKRHDSNINVLDIINECSQFNLFLIMTKTCVNIYKFKNYQKVIQMLSIFFPTMNSFLNEFMELFITNNEVYTSRKIDIIDDDFKLDGKNKRLLLLNYNIIFWILHNSIDSFIRLLYNYYDGICYIHNQKLLYIYLQNKEEKKALYNKI